MFLSKMENLVTYDLSLSVERVKIAPFGTSDIDYIDVSRIFKRDGLRGLIFFWFVFFFGVCWLVWGVL